ncbi:MAG: BolA family protein [Pseudobdellovibrionaceae bacterium]|jgi:BolA protein|nr:BolA family protein [Pseudobdellovibrionaceae bacterium]
MSVRERIFNRLEQVFSPIYLNVNDFSERHVGHAGYREGGGSHIEVIIVWDGFEGVPLMDRHRQIYKAVEAELVNGLHALKLKTLTAGEASKRNIVF